MARTMTTSSHRTTKTTTTTTTTHDDYCRGALTPEILEKLQAGAFRELCRHLQERSDQVQNMDLMSLSGFCRNCLAKWMVLEARRLVDKNQDASFLNEETIQALNALGYDEAAQHVYGMTYPEWKQRHQKKATEQQMELYKASEPLHAKHDPQLLQTRGEKPLVYYKATPTTNTGNEKDHAAATPVQTTTSSLLSNVCCQEVEQVVTTTVVVESSNGSSKPKEKKTRSLPPYQPAPLPKQGLENGVTVAILTVSDRASKGEYKTGDLSGPAVEQAIQDVLLHHPEQTSSSSNTTTTPSSPPAALQVSVVHKAIVPDDVHAIQQQLIAWSLSRTNSADSSSGAAAAASGAGGVDFIFTTGGTGMSPRDVTPEATMAVLDTPCAGLMQFVLQESSRLYHQPLATLSRGTAGIRGQTLICNLPGNPKAVHEIMPLLLPLVLHAKTHLTETTAATTTSG